MKGKVGVANEVELKETQNNSETKINVNRENFRIAYAVLALDICNNFFAEQGPTAPHIVRFHNLLYRAEKYK